MADTPSLWVELKHCRVDLLTSTVSPRQKPSSNKESPRQKLHETLSLKKLQFLDHLYLACSSENCIGIIDMITCDHPAIRKLSLEMEWMDMPFDTHQSISNALVKFEEVDLSNSDFSTKCWNTNGYDSDGDICYLSNPAVIDKDVTGSLMRTLLYEATHRTGSKLKIVTFCGESIQAEDDDQAVSYRSVICDYEHKFDIEVNLEWRTWTTEWTTVSKEEGEISGDEMTK